MKFREALVALHRTFGENWFSVQDAVVRLYFPPGGSDTLYQEYPRRYGSSLAPWARPPPTPLELLRQRAKSDILRLHKFGYLTRRLLHRNRAGRSPYMYRVSRYGVRYLARRRESDFDRRIDRLLDREIRIRALHEEGQETQEPDPFTKGNLEWNEMMDMLREAFRSPQPGMVRFDVSEPVLGPDGQPARDAQGVPLYRDREIRLPRAYVDYVLQQKDRQIAVDLGGKNVVHDLGKVTPEVLDGRATAFPPVPPPERADRISEAALATLKAKWAAEAAGIEQEKERQRQNRRKLLGQMAPEEKLRRIESWTHDGALFFDEIEPLRMSILEEMEGTGELSPLLDAARSTDGARTERTGEGTRRPSYPSSWRRSKRATERARRARDRHRSS